MNTSAVSPGRAGLLLLLSGQMLPLIDTSITNVALDAITHTLAASATCLCGASPSLASLPCCAG